MVQIGNTSYAPLDYGQVLKGVEEIKAARTNRTIRENAMKRRDDIDSARRGVLEGKLSSLGDLITHSPEAAMRTMDAITRMGQDQRVQAARQVEKIGQVSAAILNAPPEQKQAMWEQAKTMLPPEVAGKMPDQYDENWARFGIANALETSKLFEAATDEASDDRKQENLLEAKGVDQENKLESAGVDQGYTMANKAIDQGYDQTNRAADQENVLAAKSADQGYDLANKGVDQRNVLANKGVDQANELTAGAVKHTQALELERAKAQKAAAAATTKHGRAVELEGVKATEKVKAEGGATGIKSADSNNIGRAIGTAFGGFYDPVNGTFSGLDKDTATRALAIRARAERIFMEAQRSGNPIGHGEAAEQAVKEAKGAKGSDNDPLGLFN